MPSENSISIKQYIRYVTVSLIAFFSTIISREIFISILPMEDTLTGYCISMILAYTVGMIINFSMQYVHTFRMAESKKVWKMFIGFFMVVIIGGIVTVISSLAIRYWLGAYVELKENSATGAFIAGAVIASFVTYGLNSHFVFKTACEAR